MTRFIALLFLLLTACSGPYVGSDVYGADEFVMDSYKIREGKLAIFEMEGICFEEFDEKLLEEDPKKRGQIALLGMVKYGCVEADGKKRLFEVLSEAKISPKANLFKSYVMRDKKVVPVDFVKLLNCGDFSQNIVMHGGGLHLYCGGIVSEFDGDGRGEISKNNPASER